MQETNIIILSFSFFLGDVMTYRFDAILPENISDNATIPGHPQYVEIRTVIANAMESVIQEVPYFEVDVNYADLKYDGLNEKNETQVCVNGIIQLRSGTSEDLVKALESNSTNFVKNAIFGPFEANSLDLRGGVNFFLALTLQWMQFNTSKSCLATSAENWKIIYQTRRA